ncbi:helix-turn-helix domain-containing protein [Mesorhizobium australicum]|uniref:Helix-turn-helix domain-containing protein n=1 Tax=Mesorhizobium australicum TaxID=536018 RepID=A0ACC6T2N7_9HYPH
MILSKYDWGRACRFFPGFKNSPGVIRLAWELCDLYREEFGCAYPTRETLAANLGAPEESISRWLREMSEAGALTCLPIGRLPPEIREQIGRNAKRAQVYLLHFAWAIDVLQYREETISDRRVQKVTTLPPFKSEGGEVATPKGGVAVTSEGGRAATLIPYSDTLEDTLKEKGAPNGSNLGAYTRERKGQAA